MAKSRIHIVLLAGVLCLACGDDSDDGDSAGSAAGGSSGATGGAGGGAAGTGGATAGTGGGTTGGSAGSTGGGAGTAGSGGATTLDCAGACANKVSANCAGGPDQTKCEQDCSDAYGPTAEACGPTISAALACEATATFTCDMEGPTTSDCDQQWSDYYACRNDANVCVPEYYDGPCTVCEKEKCCDERTAAETPVVQECLMCMDQCMGDPACIESDCQCDAAQSLLSALQNCKSSLCMTECQ